MKDYYQVYPEKFNNKTNGITHRRWLLKANRQLTDLITRKIGQEWITHPEELSELAEYSNDSGLQEQLARVKTIKKQQLGRLIGDKTGIVVDEESIFDVQIKRFHAYKRQLLNVLHIMYLYNYLKENPETDIYPRTFIFAGKAAPGYYFAKRVIQLINRVGQVINNDDQVNDYIKVVFLPNYSVSLAEEIIPAANVSEQISTASMEASGTGNMKFMMNGALTLGTMDGANIDIYNQVGEDNIFIFGLDSDEVLDYYNSGGYNPELIYRNNLQLKQVVDQLVQPGVFVDTSNQFDTLYNSLLQGNDHYFVLKDFADYTRVQEQIARVYQNREEWLKSSLINIAYSGQFSSDSTIEKYARDIWDL